MANEGGGDKSKISEINIVCLSGLPRSGSTWLGAILSQNPRFYVTNPQSPFVELLWRNYSLWDEPNWKADFLELQDIKIPYLRKVANAYFKEFTDSPVILDVRRHWNSIKNIEMYADVFGELPKIICPVRNVEEIVASFINLFKRNGRSWGKDSISGNLFDTPYKLLLESYNSKYRDCLLFVGYEDLIKDTYSLLDRIYEFIGEPLYNHDLNSIRAHEPCIRSDKEYNLSGLHLVSSGVVESVTDARDCLSDKQFELLKELNFWKNEQLWR